LMTLLGARIWFTLCTFIYFLYHLRYLDCVLASFK
jgi:hypothetical protein